MHLLETAAEVMGLAQDGKPEDALALADFALPGATAASPSDQAALWYARAVAQHIAGDNAGAYVACDRCVALAEEAGNAGWASNGLSMRSMALTRQNRIEPALMDLARAEVALASTTDAGLRSWAHTGLGYAYLELRLYELAAPHMLLAQELDASPIPLAQAPVIDLMNLSEMHLRWADELERLDDGDGSEEIRGHRKEGHVFAERALAAALERGNHQFVATCRAMELVARPRADGVESLAELQAAYDLPDHPDYGGTRAVVGGALARTLWNLGRPDEALAIATEAAWLAETAGDWQVTASAQWLLVELQARSDMPGAESGRAYSRLLNQMLWRQRLSTLQGAQAALQVELLNRDKLQAQQAASEDPLTGVSNRRAFDDALRAIAAEVAVARATGNPDSPTSLLLIDLDEFKAVNDTYGHVVGDEVLRAVAAAIRGVARADDVVARLGGDEFVILARGADEEAGSRLAARVATAISSLHVGTRRGTVSLQASVGVATTGHSQDVTTLLADADAAMYDDKHRGRSRYRYR